MTRAPSLAYDVDSSPPAFICLGAALQLVCVVAILALNSLIVGREAGLDDDALADLVRASFIALGIGTVLQAQRPGLGSGFLCPSSIASVFLPPAMLAARMGGMSLVCGMVVLSGVLQMAASRVLYRLRAILPAEVGGVVVVLLGLSLGFIGLRFCIAPIGDTPTTVGQFGAAGVSLGVMVALKVWARGMASLLCAMIGAIAGYIVAAFVGLVPHDAAIRLVGAEWLDVPTLGQTGWRFDSGLLIPFAIATIANVLTSMACVITAQKVNDENWVRPIPASIEGGVLADGLASTISGLLGSMPVVGATSAVGLSAATGVTSRRVAYAIGGILLVLGCSPKFALVFEMMPLPVVGTALLFSAAFILVNGIQIIAARLLDARHSLMVGLSCCVGLSTAVYPELFRQLPGALQPLVASPLLLGTLLALALTALFRIGVRRTGAAAFAYDAPIEDVEDFLLSLGASWGARRDVVARANFGLTQAIEVVRDIAAPDRPIKVKASFNELKLTIELIYEGPALKFPETKPSEMEILEDDGHIALAGFILRRAANHVRSVSRNGEAVLKLEYDH